MKAFLLKNICGWWPREFSFSCGTFDISVKRVHMKKGAFQLNKYKENRQHKFSNRFLSLPSVSICGNFRKFPLSIFHSSVFLNKGLFTMDVCLEYLNRFRLLNFDSFLGRKQKCIQTSWTSSPRVTTTAQTQIFHFNHLCKINVKGLLPSP